MQRTAVICMGRGWWRGCERGYSYCTCCVAKVFPAEMSFKGKRGGESPPHNCADMRKYVCALQQTALIRDKFNNMQASFFLHTTVSKIHPEACQVRYAMKIPACFTASVLLLPCTNQNSCMVLPTRSPAEIIATKCHI